MATGLLFSIGLMAGRLGGRNPLVKGCEIVLFGAVVFVLSYLAGHYVPAFFGHPSISVGG